MARQVQIVAVEIERFLYLVAWGSVIKNAGTK